MSSAVGKLVTLFKEAAQRCAAFTKVQSSVVSVGSGSLDPDSTHALDSNQDPGEILGKCGIPQGTEIFLRTRDGPDIKFAG